MKKYLSKFRDYTNAIINNRNKQLLKTKIFHLFPVIVLVVSCYIT